jgi:glycosyltransferase involved in cell wall biosynthesis
VHTVHNAERAYVGSTDKRLFHRVFGLEPAAFILLFQGGTLAGRNLETLVDAMAHVRNPAIHLVFLGDGPLQGRLARRAHAAGIAERVHFHAAVPWSELLAYTASADVGIIPYQPTCLNNLYSTPNKLFEFAAAGLPMIATDLPELRRLIVENGMGLVTDTASPGNLAHIVDALAADATKLAGFRAGVAVARQRLDWDQEAKILMEVYRGLNP